VRIYTQYIMLMPMVFSMTSWIGTHIYIHYVNILTPMVYTMTSWIGAHIYTTPCSCLWYTR
jgi:hypothetical protein